MDTHENTSKHWACRKVHRWNRKFMRFHDDTLHCLRNGQTCSEAFTRPFGHTFLSWTIYQFDKLLNRHITSIWNKKWMSKFNKAQCQNRLFCQWNLRKNGMPMQKIRIYNALAIHRMKHNTRLWCECSKCTNESDRARARAWDRERNTKIHTLE